MGRGRRLSAVAPLVFSARPRGGRSGSRVALVCTPVWSCVAATYEGCESPLDGIAEAGHLGACELGAGYRVCEAHAAADGGDSRGRAMRGQQVAGQKGMRITRRGPFLIEDDGPP